MQPISLRRGRCSQLALAFLLLTLVSLPGLTRAQDTSPLDVVPALLDADLMTAVDVTASDEGVDATVMLAYVDTQQIIVRVKVSGNYTDYEDLTLDFVLRDEAGAKFSYAMAQRLIREDDELAEIYDVFFYAQALLDDGAGNFEIDNDYLANIGESINLQLDVSYSDTSALGQVLQQTSGPAEPVVGPISIPFTLPVVQPRVATPAETLTVGDIALTLERVSVTPSQVEVEACYTVPDAQDWQPLIVVTIGDLTVQTTGTNLLGIPSTEDTERCVEQRFSVVTGPEVETLTVTAERLQTSVPDTVEAWEGLVAELATFDIQAEAFPQPGSYFEIQSTPEGMTDAELSDIINNARENLREGIDGPWVFEVALP